VVSRASTRWAVGKAKQRSSAATDHNCACPRSLTPALGAVTWLLANSAAVVLAEAISTGLGLSMVDKAARPVAGSVTIFTRSSSTSAVLPAALEVAAVMRVVKGS
jgi:hypothetical protein